MDVTVKAVKLSFPEGCNIVVGQSHFIKTVEDLAEIMVSSVPGVEFGIAFSEASGPCLIRTEGNSEALIKDAVECAKAVAAGHTFYLIMSKAYPINVLNQIKNCQEVARIFAATANPLEALVAETAQGRGIIGVVDGYPPKGGEGDTDKTERRQMLRKFGYKY